MGKTSIDARRHIRELSIFLRKFNEVGNAEIEKFIESRENKKFLKQSLNRLIAKGYLEENHKKLKKTPAGKIFFSRQIKPIIERDVENNTKWYVLSFDVPIKENHKRRALTWILNKYGFYQLQRSVWVGPNKLAREIWEFIVENGMKNYCFPMIVEIVEGEDRLLEKIRKNKS